MKSKILKRTIDSTWHTSRTTILIALRKTWRRQ